MNYETLFSRGADTMRQSPIRQMGTVARAARRSHLLRARLSGSRCVRVGGLSGDRRRPAARARRGRAAVRAHARLHAAGGRADRDAEEPRHRGVARHHARHHRLSAGARSRRADAARSGRRRAAGAPSYTGAIAAFRNTRAVLVGVKQQPDGIDLDDLQEVLQRVRQEGRRVKFLCLDAELPESVGLAC